jgi:hypothetical protein
MRKLAAIAALILSGCTAQAQQQPPAARPAASPTPAASPAIITSAEGQTQGRFKLKITVTNIEDLKVKEGDVIVPGQIVADRVRDRVRLEFQKEGLTREIARLRQLQALPIPELKPLPSASLTAQAADIEKQRHKADTAARNLEQQQRKLDVIRAMPTTEVSEAVIPHEEIVLAERQRENNLSQAEIELAKGKLSEAQEAQRNKEYEHSLEASKRAIALREQELRQQGTVADLEARLSQVEVQLSQLSAVRSPYGGKVQRVKFESQTDQNLSIELTLVVSSNGQLGRIPRTSPSPSAGDSSPSPSSPDNSSPSPSGPDNRASDNPGQ